MHQDYLLRMIQQLSAFLTGTTSMREQDRLQEALDAIRNAYGRFAGLSPTLVHAISEEDLVQLLRARGGIDVDRGWALAELLREEAETHDAAGDEAEAYPRYVKSLRVYLEVIDSVEELPGVVNVTGIERVIERVGDTNLPEGTRIRTIDYLERTGRLAEAENLVLWSIDWPDPDGSRANQAAAFYERLSQQSDADLEQGGLSRDEVDEGLARFGEVSSLPE